MHVRDDVGQAGAGEKLEPALGVGYARRGGRGHEPEQEVEGVHEEVAQLGAFHHGLGPDEVRATPHGDGAAGVVLDGAYGGDEFAEVGEFRSPVRVGEEDVLAAGVAHAVNDRTALAPVGDQRDHADRARGDGDASRAAVRPGPRVAAGVGREDVFSGKRLRREEGVVGRAVVHEDDFPASKLLRC